MLRTARSRQGSSKRPIRRCNAQVSRRPPTKLREPPVRMTRRTALIGGLGAHLAGCLGPSRTFHYRLQLDFWNDGRRAAGSAVQYFTFRSGTRELGSRRDFSGGAGGEGALVDLGARGVIVSTFATLMPPHSQEPPDQGFGDRLIANRNWDPVQILRAGLLDAEPAIGGPELAADLMTIDRSAALPMPILDLPLLIHFPEPSNPATARRFDPRTRRGPITLASATVEMTRDPLTDGVIQSHMAWANQYWKDNLSLDGDFGFAPAGHLPAAVRARDFRAGFPVSRARSDAAVS